MKFAKFVFIGAGVWGILVLVPLYFLVDITGKPWPPPLDYPHFFYGFISVALAWQLAFLVIGSDPPRYRWLMIPAIVEKLGHVTTVAALYSRGAIATDAAMTAAPDLLLGMLFVAAFIAVPYGRTPSSPDTLTI
ncbi:MAG TPA: hypothetical protein VFK57_01375 [Vicinamibacterales bacterium]|nr:hypothetical protein [Vicinamibacterales bacterium]